MKNIYLLGATGSIGSQVLEVIDEYKDDFKLMAFSVNSNIEKAYEIIEKYQPELVCVGTLDQAIELSSRVTNVKCVYGKRGLISVATYNEEDEDGVLVNSVVGMVGLEPTIEAIEFGRDILLANKETLVVGGEIIMPLVKEYGVKLLPIDSEHSAVMQCLEGFRKEDVSNLIITASGGAFRDKTREELQDVTIEDALKHPNWSMGKKITVDCASMVNKGLEVMEAHYLFDMDYDRIQTVIHRESIVHSMVEYKDGSVMACLSNPDMRLPIAYAMNYPEKKEYSFIKKLDFKSAMKLTFEEMKFDRYPMLGLAYKVGKMGGIMPIVYNSSNEVAASLFINGKIKFLDIENIIFDSVKYFEKEYEKHNPLTLDYILSVDEMVREYVKNKYEL